MKIAIVGFGVEGRSNLAYFQQKFPAAKFVIADDNPLSDVPSDVEVRTGKKVFSEQLIDIDLVLRSPSIAPLRLHTRAEIWSATNEFFAKCPAPIIGVTGSKGKGTTCSFIASILRAAGKTVHLVGNIGVPALDALPSVQSEDVVVYELSSFQLWDAEKSPHIAVVLMIEPEHLDVHTSVEEYIDAKANIRRHQSENDICLYHPTNKFAEQIAGSWRGNAVFLDRMQREQMMVDWQIVGFTNASRYGIANENQVYIEDDYFCIRGQRICSTDHVRLPGRHNIENACAAMSAVSNITGLIISDEQYAAGLENFTGLPHRLKFVAQIGGVTYYDDSIATTPGSAIAAIKSFVQPKVFILGGHDKGGSYDELARATAGKDMRLVILIGQNAEKISDSFERCAPEVKTVILGQAAMPEIVQVASVHAQPGDVVVLSPAAASFGMFKNYADRGEQFVRAVEALRRAD